MKGKLNAGIMPLYPKINLSARLGFPVSSRLPDAEIIFSLPWKIWSFSICKFHGQDVSNYWEFYDQSWTIDKSPTLCDAKVVKIDR